MANDGGDNPRGQDPDLADVRAASTNPAAFGPIYERHVARIYAYAVQRLRDPTLAEDATATVFTRARRNRDFRPASVGAHGRSANRRRLAPDHRP